MSETALLPERPTSQEPTRRSVPASRSIACRRVLLEVASRSLTGRRCTRDCDRGRPGSRSSSTARRLGGSSTCSRRRRRRRARARARRGRARRSPSAGARPPSGGRRGACARGTRERPALPRITRRRRPAARRRGWRRAPAAGGQLRGLPVVGDHAQARDRGRDLQGGARRREGRAEGAVEEQTPDREPAPDRARQTGGRAVVGTRRVGDRRRHATAGSRRRAAEAGLGRTDPVPATERARLRLPTELPGLRRLTRACEPARAAS